MGDLVGVKVRDLIGTGLDWAIGQIDKPEGLTLDFFRSGDLDGLYVKDEDFDWVIYSPSVYWGHGGPLIDKSVTTMCSPRDGYWWAHARGPLGEHLGEGDTALIASCRAIAAANLGETVSIPAELA
jgi:hypothetical protein